MLCGQRVSLVAYRATGVFNTSDVQKEVNQVTGLGSRNRVWCECEGVVQPDRDVPLHLREGRPGREEKG